jgi:nitrogen fixation/metabolism regulation signal transduction histidine kinase
MLFRTRIFVIVFMVGMLPAVIILLISAYLLDSTLDRIGATGMESSIEAAGSMVDDVEARLGLILAGYLSERIPWNQYEDLNEWRKSNGLDIIYRKSNDSQLWSVSDSIETGEFFADNLPTSSGLQHVRFAGKSALIYAQADSPLVRGCGILMPEGYAERGRRLSSAVSAAASLSIYKDFSIQLLTTVTAVSLIIVLIVGFVLSRVVSKRLVRPLERLAEGAATLGAGNLDYRVELPGSDEFSELADSFNKMASEISENQRKLIEVERLAAWREVARRIAHEIKNPLTPITVELYRLKSKLLKSEDEKSSDMAEALDAIDRQITVLQELAGHFSTFAKEPVLHKQKCSVTDILNRQIDLYENYDNVTIMASIPEHLPLLEIDPQMMGRVFGNIIKNSIEASPESVNIDIFIAETNGALKIILKDDGPGYPPEKLENIDTPYITTKKSGTGLGLAIIKKIIDEHGGSLRLYNDNGAVVEITLPVR